MLYVPLRKRVCAVEYVLELVLISRQGFDMFERRLECLRILIDRDRGRIAVRDLEGRGRFPGQLPQPRPVVAPAGREARTPGKEGRHEMPGYSHMISDRLAVDDGLSPPCVTAGQVVVEIPEEADSPRNGRPQRREKIRRERLRTTHAHLV